MYEARHTFASILIASGVNAKAITEAEAAALVDSYLARADTFSRIAQLDEQRS